MFSLIALILGLQIHTDLREPARLYQQNGDMAAGGQIIKVLPEFKASLPIRVQATGDGRGDLDCYLLRFNKNLHGWVVASLDESGADRCTINYTPASDSSLKLWVVNHGKHPTKYEVTVDQ